jgi:membrane-associated protein
VLDTLTALLEAGAAAPWVLPAVAVLAAVDALLPPVPSEGVVVALAAVAVAGHGPHLLLLALAAALGAFAGDTLTFVVGRRFGPGRLATARHRGVRRAMAGATATLERRGAVVVLVARYVPLGRVAVNLTAGATGFAPRRFVGLAAVGATTWAAWSVAVGALAGRWLGGSPLLGSAAGIAVALVLGAAVDRLVRRLSGWGRMPGTPASTRVDHDVAQVPAATPAPSSGRSDAVPVATGSFALSTRECQ